MGLYFKESGSNLHCFFHKDIFPLATNWCVFGCFTTLCKIMAPHVAHISSDGFLKVFLPPFSFYLPCGVSATQHCLTFHTVHLPSRLRLIGNACCCCVIHCGHFPACQNKWDPYSIDCLSQLKVSVFAERPSAFFGRFVQYTHTEIFPLQR